MRVWLQDNNIFVDSEIVGEPILNWPQDETIFELLRGSNDEFIVYSLVENDCRAYKDLATNIKDQAGVIVGDKAEALEYLIDIIPRGRTYNPIEGEGGGGTSGTLTATEGTGNLGSGTALAWVTVGLGASFANKVVYIGVTSTNGITKTVSVRKPGEIGISDDISGDNSTNFIVQCNTAGQIEIFTTNTNVIFKHKTTLDVV